MAGHGSLIILAIKILHITCLAFHITKQSFDLHRASHVKLCQFSWACGIWEVKSHRQYVQPNTDHGGYPQVLELRALERESSDQRCTFSSPFGNLISHYRLSDWHPKLSISLLWAWLMWVNPCGTDNLWELWPIQFLDLQWENQPWIVMTILTGEDQTLPPYTHIHTHMKYAQHTDAHTNTLTYTLTYTPVRPCLRPCLARQLLGWHHYLIFPVTENSCSWKI